MKNAKDTALSFDELAGTDYTMFNKKMDDEVPAEEEETEGDPVDETGKKKKPSPDEGEGEANVDGDPDEEIAVSISKRLAKNLSEAQANRRSVIRKSAKVVPDSKDEVNSAIYGALKELQKEVNSPSRSPMIVSNGSVAQITKLVEGDVASYYSVMSSIVTKYAEAEVNPENRARLDDLSVAMAGILNASSTADKYAAIMNCRSMYATMLAANNMLHGDPNLVNSDVMDQQRDLWELFQIFNSVADMDVAHAGAIPVAKYRGQAGDNAIEPDITIVKPIAMIFVDQDLKRRLKELNISHDIIGDYADDNDFGILGNYPLPTCMRGNAANDAAPDEEDLSPASMARAEGTVAVSAPQFTWSRNGTDHIAQLTPAAYRKNNDAFIKEVKSLITLARAKKLYEFNPDICFGIVLTSWLNAAYAVLVEANVLGTLNEVNKGITFDEKRFIAANGDSIAFKLLSTLAVGRSNIKGDSYSFSSVFGMPYEKANEILARNLGGKFQYSKTAYDLVRAAFKTMTYTMGSETKFYIGDVVIGEHAIKVTVLPKLYLPVDVSAEHDINVSVEVPRARGEAAPVVEDIFSFCVQSTRTHWNATRNVNENDYMYNQSMLHMLCRLTQAQYDGIINTFYDNSSYDDGTGTERTFREIFGRRLQGNNREGLSYLRFFSSIAPAYNKTKLLGLVPIVDNTNSEGANFTRLAFMDQMFHKAGWSNVDTDGANTYLNFSLGDYLKAIFNMHGDWSWYESYVVCAMLLTGYASTVGAAQNNGDDPYVYHRIDYTLDQDADHGTPISTILRRARYFMDNKDWGLALTRFETSFILSDRPVESSNMISKNDIIKAFRFVKMDKTSRYVVDNLSAVNPAAKKIWMGTAAGRITNFFYQAVAGERNAVTEDAILSSLTKEYFDGSLLPYDSTRKAQLLNLTPAIIPGTDIVAYRASSVAVANYVLQDFADINHTGHKVYTKLHLNDYCLIGTDFYPSEIIYTVNVPTGTSHAYFGTGNVIAEQHGFRNIVLFDVLANAIHRAGADNGNSAGTRLLLQMISGIVSNVNTRQIIRANEDNIRTVTVGVGVNNGIAAFGGADYADLTNANAAEEESFNSSYMYPQTMIIPAYGELTGLPLMLNRNSQVADSEYLSLGKAKAFYNKLGSIVPNNNTASQVYRGEGKTKSMLFEVRQGQNTVYGVDDYDLVVTVQVRKIISLLDMEAK